MEIKELKTKIKVVFTEESEIFMAEEFLEELGGVNLGEKVVELDMSAVTSVDTVFLQLAVSIIKTINKHNNKVTIKLSEAFENAQTLYGIDLDSVAGG
ncbi:MAG: hypothetical protein C0603_10370 [Denitrovibrio sp.]|nr:MAG: hypothetical protein C0603_10370 [Denitrovibrio sp.]